MVVWKKFTLCTRFSIVWFTVCMRVLRLTERVVVEHTITFSADMLLVGGLPSIGRYLIGLVVLRVCESSCRTFKMVSSSLSGLPFGHRAFSFVLLIVLCIRLYDGSASVPFPRFLCRARGSVRQ